MAMFLSYTGTLLVLSMVYNTADCVNFVTGVKLEFQTFYNKDQDFVCLDQSATIPFSSVNDDYCDCVDGSDEPGTSACPEGRFYCQNNGHVGEYIQSSRVNDGICDCCDGSDEYDSPVACFNECDKHQQEALKKMKIAMEIANKGYANKIEMIRIAQENKIEKESRFAVLKDILENRRVQLEELRIAKEAAEAPEKEAKDQHQRLWDEEQAKQREIKETALRAQHFSLLDIDKNELISFEDLLSNPYLESDFTEEAAKDMLAGVEWVNTEKFAELWPNLKDKVLINGRQQPEEKYSETGEADLPPIELPPIKEQVVEPKGEAPSPIEDLEGEDDDDTEEDHDKEEDNDKEEVTKESVESPPVESENKMPEYDENTKSLIEIADNRRHEFDEMDREVNELNKEHKEIEEFLALDMGLNGEFMSLKGQCFELNDREYTYKLCPFNEATQKQKSGGSETNLGKWGAWGELPMKYSFMTYKDGTNCWNGPARSTKVNLSCGVENALVAVSEPSRCEYLMEFHTSALCEKVTSTDAHTEL